MNVGIVSHGAEMGGAERSLLQTARTLLRAGAGVCVALPKRGPLCQRLEELRVPHAVIPYFWWAIRYPKPLAVRLARHPPSLAAAVPMARFLSARACDIVLTNSEVVYTGAVAAGLLRKPHVWQLREIRRAWRFDFGSRASLALMRRATTRFVANSQATRQSYLPGLGDAPIDVLYPGFEIGEPPPLRPRPSSTFRCVVVGTVMPSKRQHEAIGAVRVLRAEGVEVALDVIGGDGPDSNYRRALQRAVAAEPIRGQVQFVGYVDDTGRQIACADAVVVPSRESFGRVAVEAMLAGTPVIASRWGAAEEIIRGGETGLLYEPGDPARLAAAIRRLVEHPAEGERLSAAAWESAMERFNAQRHTDGLLELLASVL